VDLGAIDADPTPSSDGGVKTLPEKAYTAQRRNEILIQECSAEDMKAAFIRQLGIVRVPGRATFMKFYALAPRYLLMAHYSDCCKSPEELVKSLACLKEQRAEWEGLVSEEKKFGLVTLNKKDFNAQPQDVKDLYQGSMKQAGLRSSYDEFNLRVTDALSRSLIETKTHSVYNCVDARTAIVLNTTGCPLGPVVLDPQGHARQGLILSMTFKWQIGGLLVDWAQADVPKAGAEGGIVIDRQCLPMIMGVVPYKVTVSHPQLAGEEMKLGMPLIYRSQKEINKENRSIQYMWGMVGGRMIVVRILFGEDADTYNATSMCGGIERARGPLLEERGRAEILTMFEGRRHLLTEFETNLTFFWVEKKGARVCDLVRRVRSKDSVEAYFCEGSNRSDFYDYLVSDPRLNQVLNGDVRWKINAIISAFKLGAKLKNQINKIWDYLWTEERKASVRSFTETPSYRGSYIAAGHAHLALCKVSVSLVGMSDDAFINFLVKNEKDFRALEWTEKDLSYYDKGTFNANRSRIRRGVKALCEWAVEE